MTSATPSLPWIPVPPSVPRILLELVWVPWAIVAAARPTGERHVAAVGSAADPAIAAPAQP
jgi:hypothetical protein